MIDNLEGKILIAPPKMRDYRFAKTVLYCWKHNVGGAAAVIINRPIKSPTFKYEDLYEIINNVLRRFVA